MAAVTKRFDALECVSHEAIIAQHKVLHGAASCVSVAAAFTALEKPVKCVRSHNAAVKLAHGSRICKLVALVVIVHDGDSLVACVVDVAPQMPSVAHSTITLMDIAVH